MAEEEYHEGGYESLVWIRDKDGKEYACSAEALKGNLRGFHSIRINDQWRLIFRWSGGQSHDVQIVDYHR